MARLTIRVTIQTQSHKSDPHIKKPTNDRVSFAGIGSVQYAVQLVS